MDYKKIYDAIISKAKFEESVRIKKKKEKKEYYETHHIIPKCLGGNDSNSNLAVLTAREHFICHWLLHNTYPDNDKLKGINKKI